MYEVGAIIIPILWMVKLRHTEVEKFNQGPMAMQSAEADISQAVRFWLSLRFAMKLWRLPGRKDPRIPAAAWKWASVIL